MRRPRSDLLGVLSVVILLLGAVQAFAAVGDFKGAWGSWGSGVGQFDGAIGVAVAANGDVYVAELHGQRIQYFGPTGSYKGQWGTEGSGNGQFLGPASVAIAPNGDIYVADSNNHRVQYFGPTGGYKGQWGLAGSDIGEFANPSGIAIARNGDVYVADSSNHRIQYFGPTGIPKGAWGWHGDSAGLFTVPRGVGIAPNGDVYVSDTNNHRIQFFGPTGSYKGTWGTEGSGDGQFLYPTGLAVAPSGDVYIADASSNRIQYFAGTSLPPAIQVAGANRYATAVEASKLAFPAGAETAVIATGANWPDALGGTSLAGVVHGPILLVERDAVPSAVMNEIVRLKAQSAIILGGPNAVGTGVESALKKKLGIANVDRIAGTDRYDTANKVARAVIASQGAGYDGEAFVATGADFPDALAAAPLAASLHWPLFLVNPKAGLSASTRAAMADVGEAIILGGTAVVPKATEDAIKAMPGKTTGRLDGPDRYATAVAVANYAVTRQYHTWNRVGITTGTDFPDALAGGVLQGKMGSVMLLTPSAALNARTAGALLANKSKISTVTFFGGTNAISTQVRTQVGNLVK